MINVGIIGCGVIGGVMKKWIEEHNPQCKLFVLDPPKGMEDDLSFCDVIFVSIHIPTEEDSKQNIHLLKQLLNSCPNVPIFIRTTVLPGTTDSLSLELKKDIYFLPEFLTERTAYEDFCKQSMIYTGCYELLKSIFVGKHFITMTNLEAEFTKYAHNVFGALKVTYFNGIYELAKKYGCDFNRIREGCLLSGYIGPDHTRVPGPDGKLGYGGKCFPKDVKAFVNFCKDLGIYKLVCNLETINDIYRSEKLV